MTLVERLRGAHLRWNSTQLSPAELDRAAEGCAGWLRSQGVTAGDRVAIDLAGGIPFAIALLATLRLGITAAPVDVQLKKDERRALLDDLQPRLVVSEVPGWNVPLTPTLLGLPKWASPARGEGVPTTSSLVRAVTASPLEGSGLNREERAGDGWSPAEAPPLILYTSGSTGRPKGAVLSQAALEFAIDSWAGPVLGLTDNDVVLQVLPLAHSYGLCAGLLAPMLVGAHVVMRDRFIPEQVLDELHDRRVTVFPGVSTMFTRLLAQPECSPHKLSTVRLVLSGAAPCSDELCAEWLGRTDTRIQRGYGMTELFRPISHLCDAPADEAGVVGRPVPGVRVRVVDDAGQEVPPGELGELVIFSPAAMDGYLNAPAETAEVLRDGWFWTGDLATVDQTQGVRIRGRKRERILRGGYSVFPSEVEGVLLGHPAVVEVVVLGMPHAELGEDVIAFVVLSNDRDSVGADELVEYCRERLAAFKYPRQVVVLPQLPRTSSGKVLKSQLRLDLAARVTPV